MSCSALHGGVASNTARASGRPGNSPSTRRKSAVPAAIGGAKVFVREDSPQWEAWQRHLRATGRAGSPVTERGGVRGWSFDGEWPPAAAAVA